MSGTIKFHISLADYQKKILDSPKRFTVTEASTKSGKTFSHIYWQAKQVHADWNKSGYNHWWVAPVNSQAQLAYKRAKRKFQHIPGYQFFDSKGNEKMITTAGVEWHFKTAKDSNNLYGEDVYSVVFDEFTRAKQDAWFALRSTVTATKAKVKFIGNFRGIANWGHQLSLKAKDPDSEYDYFRINAWDAVDAGILDREEVLQAQKDLPENVFKELYLAEEATAENQLISNERIQDFFTNSYVPPIGQKYLTCDIAMQGGDLFIVYVWHGWVATHRYAFAKTTGEEVERFIKNSAEKHSVPRSNIIYDADGLGNYLQGYLSNAVSFHNNATPIKIAGQRLEYKNLKSQVHHRFTQQVEKAEAWYAIDNEEIKPDLVKQLQFIRNQSDGTTDKFAVLKKEEIKDWVGHSPDDMDALALRAYFDLKPTFTAGFSAA